jgi:hypothetical protein
MSNPTNPVARAMREIIPIKDGNGIYRSRTHAATFFQAIRIVRGRFFWSAEAQGIHAALEGDQRDSNPHFDPRRPGHASVCDWFRGYDRAALLKRAGIARATADGV